MKRICHLVLCIMVSVASIGPAWAQDVSPYRAHDAQRERPAIVTPGKNGAPPSDAIVLYDGTDLSHWEAADGTAPRWKQSDGSMYPTSDSGPLRTKRGFGDVQLHLEWSAPTPPKGNSQGRGNSGVYLMTKYEIQILDSYENETYADGQAGAIYGQNPPMVNASRAPGEWQTYDIIFHRPRFDDEGTLLQPAYVTALHNGVVAQDHFAFWGPTNWLKYDSYAPHENRLPIQLQDHGNPVRFRNIWVRELPNAPTYKTLAAVEPKLEVSNDQLERYVGFYGKNGDRNFQVKKKGDDLSLVFWERDFALVPYSETNFQFRSTAAEVNFDVAPDGTVTGMKVTITGHTQHVDKQ